MKTLIPFAFITLLGATALLICFWIGESNLTSPLTFIFLGLVGFCKTIFKLYKRYIRYVIESEIKMENVIHISDYIA